MKTHTRTWYKEFHQSLRDAGVCVRCTDWKWLLGCSSQESQSIWAAGNRWAKNVMTGSIRWPQGQILVIFAIYISPFPVQWQYCSSRPPWKWVTPPDHSWPELRTTGVTPKPSIWLPVLDPPEFPLSDVVADPSVPEPLWQAEPLCWSRLDTFISHSGMLPVFKPQRYGGCVVLQHNLIYFGW